MAVDNPLQSSLERAFRIENEALIADKQIRDTAALNIPAASRNTALRDFGRGLALPLLKLGGSENNAKHMMGAFGLDHTKEGPVLNETTGDINMLAGGMVQGIPLSFGFRGALAAGSMALKSFGIGARPTGALLNASRRIETLKELTKFNADVVFQSVAGAAADINEIGVNEDKVYHERKWENFNQAFKLNTLFEGAFGATAGGVAWSIKKGVSNKNYRKQANVGNHTLLNLDSDAISTFNTGGLKDVDIKLNENGFVSLEEFNRITENDFKTIEEMREALNSGDLDIEHAAIIDEATGEIYILSESFGMAKGKILSNGAKVLDLKDSNIKKGMYDLKFGNNPVLTGLDKSTVSVMELLAKMAEDEGSSAYTKSSSYTVKIDENGKVVPSSKETRGGSTEINPKIKNIIEESGYEKPDNEISIKRERSIFQQMLVAKKFSDLSKLDGTIDINLKDFKLLYEAVRNNDNISSGITNMFIGLQDATFKDNDANSRTYKAFFETQELEKGEGFKILGLKDEFKNALEASLGMTLINLPESVDGYLGKDLTKQVIDGAINIMGINGKTDTSSLNNFVQALANDLVGKADTTQDLLFRAEDSNAAMEDGTPTSKRELQQWVQDLRNLFGATFEERSTFVNNILKKGYDSEKYGANFTGESGYITNKSFVNDEDTNIMAKVLAETKVNFTEEGTKLINYLKALVDGMEGKTKVMLEFGKIMGDIDPHMTERIYNSSSPNFKEIIRKKIMSKVREVEDIHRMMGDYAGADFTFDVEILDLTRVIYSGNTNPLSSTLFRVVSNTNKSEVKLDWSKKSHNLESAKRAVLANLGIKVEGIHADATKVLKDLGVKTPEEAIDLLFKYTQDAFMIEENGKYRLDPEIYNRTANHETGSMDQLHIDLSKMDNKFKELTKKLPPYLKFDSEGIITVGSIEQMVAIRNSKGEKVHVFKEIDSSNSGYTLVKSALGFKDTRVGIGGKIDITIPDPYTELGDILGISRKLAKTLFIPKNYEASLGAVTEAYSKAMLESYFEKGEMPAPLQDALQATITTDLATFKIFDDLLRKIENKNIVKDILKELEDITVENTSGKTEVEIRKELIDNINALLKTGSLTKSVTADISKIADAMMKKGNKPFSALYKIFDTTGKAKKRGTFEPEFLLSENEIEQLVKYASSRFSQKNKTAFAKIEEANYNFVDSDGNNYNMKRHYDRAINDLVKIATENFYSNYLKKTIPESEIAGVLEKAIKELGEKVDHDLILEMKRKFNGPTSVEGIISILSKHNIFKEDMTSISILNNIIPEIPVANGKNIKLITVKGYANNESHINYKGPTLQVTFQPIFTISQDAIIASKAIADGYYNIQDALVGIDSLQERTRIANETIAHLINEVNIGENILAAYTSLVEMTENGIGINEIDIEAKTAIAKKIAEQKYLKANGGRLPPPELETALIADQLNTMMIGDSKGLTAFQKRLEVLSENIKQNKKKNGITPDTEIYNVSDGMESNGAKASNGEVTLKETSPKKLSEDILTSDRVLTLGRMQKMSTKLGSFMTKIKHGIESNFHGARIKSFKKGTKQSVAIKTGSGDNIAFTVKIGHEKFTPDAHRELVHEIVHVVTKDKLDLLFDTSKIENDKTLLSLINEMSDSGKMSIKLETAIEGESLSQFFEILIGNEELMLNQENFATIFAKGTDTKTYDLSQHIQKIKFDGVEMITPDDFNKYLVSKGYETAINQLNDIRKRYSATLNTNPEILAFMNGQKVEKFKSSMKGIAKSITDNNNKTKKLVESKLSTIGFSDIFTLTPTREAIESVLGFKRQHEATMMEQSIALAKELQKVVKQSDYEGSFDKDVGTLAALGATHKFIKEFLESNSSGSFSRAINIKDVKLTKEIKNIFKEANKLSAFDDFMKEINTLEKTSSLEAMAKKWTQKLTADKNIQVAMYDNFISVIKDMHAIKKAGSASNIKRIKAFYEKARNSKATDPDTNLRQVAADLLTMLDKQHSNANTLLGTNIEVNANSSTKRGYLTLDKPEPDRLLGTVILDNKTMYLVTQDIESHIFAAESGQLMTYDVTNEMKGLYSFKDNDKNVISFNPTNLNLDSSNVDASISTQIIKNAHLKNYQDTAGRLVHKTQQTLVDAGVLIPKAVFDKLPIDLQEHYSVTNDSVANTSLNGKHYYKKTWDKYFVGTKGVDFSNEAMGKIVGTAVGDVVAPLLRLLIKYVEQLKRVLLNYSPASYINSFSSSMITYMVNGSDIYKMKEHSLKARKLMKEYKKLLTEATNLTTEEGRVKALAALEKHELHDVYLSGIFSTIRSDAYSTGSMQENALISSLNHIFKDKEAGNKFKTLLADPSTEWGKKIGTVYDMTEVLPKVMMYLSRKNKIGKQLAIQEVLLAFPTYNNMGVIPGVFDLFSPFTKYLLNYPKMLMFASSENKVRLTAISAMIMLGTKATYDEEVTKEDQWFYDNDFIQPIDNVFKSTGSMSPYNSPLRGVTGTKVIDVTFAYSATKSMIDIVELLNPMTTPK